MSPEKQRILIAEACGWKQQSAAPGLNPQWRDAKGSFYDLPDYLSDLNAMHEAEKHLLKVKVSTYLKNLRRLVNMDYFQEISEFNYIHATATVRAKAFLITIGKWDETK